MRLLGLLTSLLEHSHQDHVQICLIGVGIDGHLLPYCIVIRVTELNENLGSEWSFLSEILEFLRVLLVLFYVDIC